MFYRLEGKKVVPVQDMSSVKDMSVEDRIVRRTVFYDGRILSTVFLTINHSMTILTPDEEPILFETMVFGDTEGDEILRRFSSWDEAEAFHIKTVQHMVKFGAVITEEKFKHFPKENAEDENKTSRFDLIDLE
jgi:hypothetical protein